MIFDFTDCDDSWTQEFLSQGGYSALLSRLIELLEVEWRLVVFYVQRE
jgi:hypothetical protein